MSSSEGVLRNAARALERVNEEGGGGGGSGTNTPDASMNIRPLEDPYLVGEVAAARARSERLARERGDDVLYREDRRWDWFLGKCSVGCAGFGRRLVPIGMLLLLLRDVC